MGFGGSNKKKLKVKVAFPDDRGISLNGIREFKTDFPDGNKRCSKTPDEKNGNNFIDLIARLNADIIINEFKLNKLLQIKKK